MVKSRVPAATQLRSPTCPCWWPLLQVWTESQERGEAGGVYLFSDRASAEAYMAMHEARLKVFGVPHVNVKVWAARVGGTQIKQGAGQPHNPPPLTPTTCCCSIST